MPYKLLWEISVPTLMASKLIFKELQAILLKLARTGDLQNITQQNQTQLKYQPSRFSDGVKPEWTFVGTLDSNLDISPVSIRMNWHPGKGQMKANPPSRNSILLTVRSGKVTQIMRRKGTDERNLRKQLRRNQDYHPLFSAFLKRKQTTPILLHIFRLPFH